MTNSIIDHLDFIIDEDTNTDTDEVISMVNSLITIPEIATNAKEIGIDLEATLYALHYDLESVEIEELDEEFDVCLEDGLGSESYPTIPLFKEGVATDDFAFGNVHFGVFKGLPVIGIEGGVGGLIILTNATEFPDDE